jgi:eukaryotic-like serine/threonine-protein kinase
MSTDATAGAAPELVPGATFGPYRIVRLLGRGGMGAVYEAEHAGDGRIVALKLLSVDLDKMDSRERFLREGQSAAAINHPNAVYIYGTEEIEGTPAISMELVPGGTLEDKVKEHGPLPWPEAVEYIIDIIDGLDAAHAAGVLHRDVKPANCFIGSDGTVKIGDFGLSKPVGGEEAHKLTQTGLFLGTPVFSSPEQLLGENLDARSDIYAVGVTFYQLLTGKLPYSASGSMMQVVAAVLNGVPSPLSEARPGLPQQVIDVVMKAMARKAADRYQSYDEFRAAVLALRTTEAAPATLWDRFRASIIDWSINTVLSWIIVWSFLGGVMTTASGKVQSASWTGTLVSLAVALLVVGIPEGLRGASVGKWVIGIRVSGPEGVPPGIVRAFGRVLLLGAADLATVAFQRLAATQNSSAAIAFLAIAIFRGVFLVTARRSNGWRLLHDVLTGTRVVASRALASGRRGETHRVTVPALSGAETQIGPYVVIGTVASSATHAVEETAEARVLRAWDPAMRRHVWIVPASSGSSELSSSRRTSSRLTRLRWVGGRRAGSDALGNWDAFEAPIGEPLSDRLTRPVTWGVLRDWLEDVASELIAAEQDGTSVMVRSAGELWVTPNDRIVFPEVARRNVHDVRIGATPAPMLLVGDLIDRVRAASTAKIPAPAYASRAIATARASGSPADLLVALKATIGRPVETTRARRAGLIAATALPVVALTIAGSFSARQSVKLDREGYLLSSLLSFAADSASTHPDSIAKRRAAAEANPDPTRRVFNALRRLGLMVVTAPDTLTPPDSLRERRRLAEVYIVTAMTKRARDTVTSVLAGNTPPERRQRMAILARNQNVDSATATKARFLVDSVWKGKVPGNGPDAIFNVIPFFVALTSLCIGAFISIVSGLIARRGPLMRGFQLDIVTADGAPAGRLRILARNIAIWYMAVLCIAIFVVATRVPVATLATLLVVVATATAVVWLIAVASNLRSPSRGLAERLTGTWLVPE